VAFLQDLRATSESRPAQDEALLGLMAVDSTRSEVLDEVVQRVVSREPPFSAWTLTLAFPTHFDRVLKEFWAYVKGGGDAEQAVQALGSYKGHDPQQVAQIVAEIERIWHPGKFGWAVARAAEDLLRHSDQLTVTPSELMELAKRLIREGSPEARGPITYFATSADYQSAATRQAQAELLDLLIETARTDRELAEVITKLHGDPKSISGTVSRALIRPLEDPQEFQQLLLSAAVFNKDLAYGLAAGIGPTSASVPEGVISELEALVASGVAAPEAARQIRRRDWYE
jgi:hypothetical protein